MRKIATFALAIATLVLCAIVPMVLFTGAARAADIPSSVTGDYVGGGYACRVLAQTVRDTGQNGIELKCTRPSNEQAGGLTIGPQACPNEWYLVPLSQWGGGDQLTLDKGLQWRDYIAPDGSLVTTLGVGIVDKTPATWLRITDHAVGTITVRIGAFDTLIVGGGDALVLSKAQQITPVAPYPGCGTTAPADLLPQPPAVPYYPRLCRQFGLYCGH